MRWVNATAWYGLFLARLLREAGHEVMTVGLPGTKSFALAGEWGLQPLGLPLNNGNPLKAFSLYSRLRELVRSFRPQVVNCHRGESFVLWGMLKNAVPGAPFALVRTRGDQRPVRNNLINRQLYAKVSDALIATNSGIARAMTDNLGAAPAKVHTIIGGVDEKIFYPDPADGQDVRSALGFGSDEFVVGLLGRLDPVKGHEVLIRALGELRLKYGERFKFRFLCIGEESSLSYTDLDQMLEVAGIRARSLVTGRVENVRAYINALNLGVLASVSSEAIARAALEIMACGVPLLSSDVGVMPDILPREVLTPVGDVERLRDALENYWFNTPALESLAGACEQAVRHLKSEDFLSRTLEVYRSCLKR